MDVIFKEGMVYLQGVKFGKVSFIGISQIQHIYEKERNIVAHLIFFSRSIWQLNSSLVKNNAVFCFHAPFSLNKQRLCWQYKCVSELLDMEHIISEVTAFRDG